MTITLDADMMARIEAEALRVIHEERKQLLATSEQAAEMMSTKVRSLKRTGLKPRLNQP